MVLPLDPLLSAAQIAGQLGCSRKHVYALIHQKKLPPPLKNGRSSRWRQSDLERLIRSLPRRLSAPRRRG